MHLKIKIYWSFKQDKTLLEKEEIAGQRTLNFSCNPTIFGKVYSYDRLFTKALIHSLPQNLTFNHPEGQGH